MKIFRKTKLIRLMLLSLIFYLSAMLMQSCASAGNHRRKGKLSEAVKKASNDNEEDRKVETKPDPDPWWYDDSDEDSVEIVQEPVVNERTGDTTLAVLSGAESKSNLTQQGEISPDKPPEFPIWLALSGGTGLLKQEDFYGLNHFNITI